MTKRNATALNGMAIMLSQLLTFALGLGASVLITRKLGPEQYGQYAQIIWLGTSLGIVAVFGFGNGLTRFVAQLESSQNHNASKQLIGLTVSVVAFITVLLTVTLWLAAPSIAPFVGLSSPQYVRASALLVCAAPVTMLVISPLKGKQKFREVAVLLFFMSLITGTIQLGLIALNASITWFALATGTGALCALAYGLRNTRLTDLLQTSARSDRTLIKSYLKYAAVMGAVFLTDAVVWQRSEMLFLGYFGMTIDAGFYSIAYTLSSAPMLLIPGAIGTMTLPMAAAQLHHNEHAKSAALFQNSIRYTLLLGCPIAVLGTILGPLLLTTVYGTDYQSSAALLPILVWGALAGVTAWNAASLLQAKGKPKMLLLIGVVAGLVNLAFDYLLIKQLGAVGAAYANTLSGILAASLVIVAARQILNLEVRFAMLLRVLMATSLAFAPAYFILLLGNKTVLSTILGAVVFAALYCALVTIAKAITEQELSDLSRLPASISVSLQNRRR